MGEMHYRKYKTSADLQLFLNTIIEAGYCGITTREIIRRTGLCAINSLAAEVKKNRIPLPDAKQIGKLFYYYPPPPGYYDFEEEKWVIYQEGQLEMKLEQA